MKRLRELFPVVVVLLACGAQSAPPEGSPSTGGSGATSGAASSGGSAAIAGQSGGSADPGRAGEGNAGGAATAGNAANESGGGQGGAAIGGNAGAGVAGAAASGSNGGATGGGGNAGQPGAGGSVPLPDGVVRLFPPPGATNVCADPQLRLGFRTVPKLGSSGKLRVYEANGGTAVVTVDFAAAMVTKTVGGQELALPRQVYVEGNDVVVPLDSKALGYAKEYYVTLEAGAIQPPTGTFSVTDTTAWRFRTWVTAPSPGDATVALDGTGQFCSWQGALDAVPQKNTAPVTISIASGSYYGVVYVSGKQNITLRGEERKTTVLAGTNNENLNPGTRRRALFGADDTSGLVLENLAVKNLTPQGGSQAEALRLQGCDKCVLRKVDATSLQDTLLWSGRLYAEDCYVAGNVDFVWGTGAAYFNRCEIKTVGRAGYIVQARNGADSYGYVFVGSKISSDAGITGNVLARVDVAAYPNSHVAFIDCVLGRHISKAGFTITGGSAPSSLRFWEYGSKDESGAPTDVSGRVAGIQLTAQQAEQMRDPKVVLGGWDPTP